jgi:hypothetical protein
METKRALLRISILVMTISSCLCCSKEQDDKTIPTDNGYGQVNFTLDNSHASSVNLGDQTQTLSVTDKNNVKWTLEIPVQPYTEPTAITMTPIGSFGSSDVQCTPLSGVVFGPDGFVFAAPGTLTVEFPTIQTGKPLFYSMNGTGKNDPLDLMPADQDGKIYTLTLYHFSGTMAGEPFDPSKAYQDCKANYDAAMAEAKALWNQPITIIEPPKTPINPCTGTLLRSQEIAVNGFVDALCQPENGILSKLLTAQKGMCLLRDENSDPNCDASLNASGMSERLISKAQMLIDQYGNADDYYVPVVRAVIKIAKQDAMLGGLAQHDFLARLTGMIIKVRENTLKKLREEHNYKVIPQLISLTRDLCLISNDCDSETYLETIIKAATFKATIITEIVKSDNSLMVMTQFSPTFQLDEYLNRFTASANIDCMEGSIKKGDDHKKCGGEWANLIPFNVPMESDLTIDVCSANEAIIAYDPLLDINSNSEMQTGSYWNPTPEPGHCETFTNKSGWASAAFMAQVGIPLMYDFNRGFVITEQSVNEKAILIDKTIPAMVGPFIFTITVKLEHTPL